MKISVVTVCFNAVAEIEQTMLSVLNQTHPDVEYIVIDGGSTDGTVDIIKKYAQRLAYWVSEPDRGIYDAMNKGIAHATGAYINFMNAGDRFASPSVLAQVAALSPSATILMCDWNDCEKDGRRHKKPLAFDYLKETIICCHQALLVNTQYHKKHPFDITLRYCADYNMIYRAYFMDHADFSYIPVILSDYTHDIGLTASNQAKVAREKLKIWIDATYIDYLKVEFNILAHRVWNVVKNTLPKNMVDKILTKHYSKKRHQNVS